MREFHRPPLSRIRYCPAGLIADVRGSLPQNRIHESGCACYAGPFHEVDGFVHGRGMRNSFQITNLVDADSKSDNHLGVQPGNRAIRIKLDEIIERRLMPEHSQYKLARESPVLR